MVSHDQEGPPAEPQVRPDGRPTPDIPSERRPILDRIRTAIETPGDRLLVVGDPGVGKTTLLEEAVRTAAADGVRVLYARASEAQAQQPFHGLIDLLACVEEERLARLPTIQREAVEVALARRPVERDLPPMALSAAVAAIVSGMVQDQQVAVVIDDRPWLDAETAAILEYVFSRPAQNNRAAALVATQRIDWPPPPGVDRSTLRPAALNSITRAGFAPSSILHITGLGPQALQTLITSLLGRSISAPLLAAIHESTGGNPLWAMELAWNQVDLGPETAELHVPPSIAEAVHACLKSMPAETKEVLSVVAAMGSAPVASVLTLIGDKSEALVNALEMGVIREVDGLLRAGNPLCVWAAMDLLGPAERMNLHHRIAAVASSAAEKAYHADRGAFPGDDESVAAALGAAAAEARAQGGTLSALNQAERSLLRTPATSEHRDQRVLVVAELALAVGNFTRTTEVLDQLDLRSLELSLLDRALPLRLDSILADQGEENLLLELHRLADKLADSPIHQAVIGTYYAETASFGADERAAQAWAAFETLRLHPELPISTHRAVGALFLARLDAGCGFDHDLLALGAGLEKDLSLVAPSDSVAAIQGFYAYQAGDFEKSRSALKRLIRQTTESGDSSIGGLFRVHLAIVETSSGHPAEADLLLAQFDAEDPSPQTPMPSLVRVRGLLAIARDESEALAALLAQPHGPGSETVARFTRLALRGIHAARSENWPAAVPALQEAHSIAEARGVHEPGRRMWIDFELLEALVAIGRLGEAAEILKGVQAVADRTGHPLLTGVELRLRGSLVAADGDLAGAEQLLVDSVARLTGDDFRFERARSLLELGRVLRRRRARLRARQALEQALAIAENIEDLPLQTRIRHALQVSTSSRSGELLTPSETRVAEAVAAGRTNKEIASDQYISVRTVEAHLSTIYRKLGLRSRSQLTVRLRAQKAPVS